MVGGSILIDFLTILTSAPNQDDKFTFVLMPILEMLVKAAMIGMAIYYERKKQQKEG